MLSDIYKTVLQSLVSIVILFILTRIMGKKQISQLTFFDYVSGISIGSISAALAVEDSVGYVRGITGLIIYALFPILLSYVSLKSCRGRILLDGKPEVLIQNGQIVEKGLAKTKMNINDLLEECRLNGIFNITDIEYAVLETSGKLSIQLNSSKRPLTPKDINIKIPNKAPCVTLVVDGKILDKHLQAINKDCNWLEQELSRQGIRACSDVLLAFLDDTSTLQTYLKNAAPPITPVL